MSNIESFENFPELPANAPPLLFIHGACLGAWCWTDGFLDFFAKAGYHAVAFNLRGHGRSSKPTSLAKISIDDYVDDVISVASKLAVPPIVIGHSMGGLIAQRFAACQPTSAIVLLAPSPYAGMRSQALRLFRAHPWSFFVASLTKNIFRIYPDNDSVREIMFSPKTPEVIVTHCRERMQKESWRACQEMNEPLKQPYPIQSPMLVLGGEHDSTVAPEAICETAVAYGAPCHIFADMGHNLMLEPAWQTVARYIDNWLCQEVTT